MFFINIVVLVSSPKIIFVGEIWFSFEEIRRDKLNLFDLSRSLLWEWSSSSVAEDEELKIFNSISSSVSGEKLREDLE